MCAAPCAPSYAAAVPDPTPPVRRQRLGAYAVLRREHEGREQILLAELSARTSAAGAWTLPGGGVDHGEDPWATVVREAWEETGLRVRPTRVLTVTHSRWQGTGDDGAPTDRHSVQIVFAAEVDEADRDREPRVMEADSSTSRSAWIDLEEARGLRLLTAARHALGSL